MTSYSIRSSWTDFTAKRKKRKYIILDVVKVASVLWILIIHSYNFAFQWLTFSNKVDEVYHSLFTQWIGNGTFAIDNFFLVSGLLSCLDAEKSTRSSTPISRFRSSSVRVLARYLRLMPSLMFMVLVSVTLLPDTKATTMFNSWCRDKWLLNLFMVQNYINTQTMCFSHSWYVAASFQLFILLQLWMALPRLSGAARDLILVAVIIISQTFVARETYSKQLPSMPLLPAQRPGAMVDYYTFLYIKPNYWLSSYLIGVLAARRFEGSSRGGNKLGEKLLTVGAVILATVVMLILILLTQPYFKSSIPMSSFSSSLHAFIARPLWSICLAFLLLRSVNSRCATTLAFVTPLSKLTYPVYLIHPVVMAVFYGNRVETFHFDHQLLVYLTLGNAVFSFLTAFILYLTFERPIIRLLGEQLPNSEKLDLERTNAISMRTKAKNRL